MRLLIVAYAFPPGSAVGAMRPLRWCKHLMRTSPWVPVVISVQRELSRQDETLAAELPAGVEVHRVRSWEPLRGLESLGAGRKAAPAAAPAAAPVAAAVATGAKRPGGPKSWLRDALSTPDEQGLWNLAVIAKALALHRRQPFDAVLVTSPPWSAQFAGRVLSSLLRVPWITDYRDPWNDIDRGRRSPAFEAWSRRCEEAILPRAAAVISTSETYTEILRGRFPAVDPEVFTTIHNGFDETKFPAAEPPGPARFTLVHLGTLYEIWQPHALLRGLQAWLARRPELRPQVVLRFVGKPGARTLAVLSELGLDDVLEVTGYVDHAAAIEHCRGADALLLALGSGPSVPAGWLPSKLFEYIACQRPILANVRRGEAQRLIEGAAAGQVFADDEIAAMADALDGLFAAKQAGSGTLRWRNDAEAVARLTQQRLGARLVEVLDGARSRHRGRRS